MTSIAIALADTLLSGAIQFLLQKQKVDALITTARLEGREITVEELSTIANLRDAAVADVNALLDGIE